MLDKFLKIAEILIFLCAFISGFIEWEHGNYTMAFILFSLVTIENRIFWGKEAR